MRKSVFIYSSELQKYHYPPEHPFNVDRAARVRKVLNSMGLLSGDGRSEVPPRAADRITLKKFHSARYLHALKSASKGKWDAEALDMGIGSGDCPVFDGLYDFAVLACGATLTGVKMILSNSADVAFNPSGGFHHAGPEKAAGFCYINDVALACLILAEQKKKVLYLDVDVHHGDGVAYAFYDSCDVMTISLHQNPRTLFPGTGYEDEIGAGPGKGFCINVPLPVGTYDEAYLKAFNAIVPPLTAAFNPDVIVFELGADALAGDPLANLYLTNNVYVEIIQFLLSCNKFILTTGGGGYNVENTVRAWALAWAVLSGADVDPDKIPAVGGVMLGSTEWQGGLRDRELVVGRAQREMVSPAVERTIEAVKATVFPIHGL
jgi:acetoin utilization protein AcuC